MGSYKITYTDDGFVNVTDPNGVQTESEPYPETGIGLMQIGGKTVVIVTPDYEGDLDHDTVYELSSCPTVTVGDFIEDDDEDEGVEDDDDLEGVEEVEEEVEE